MDKQYYSSAFLKRLIHTIKMLYFAPYRFVECKCSLGFLIPFLTTQLTSKSSLDFTCAGTGKKSEDAGNKIKRSVEKVSGQTALNRLMRRTSPQKTFNTPTLRRSRIKDQAVLAATGEQIWLLARAGKPNTWHFSSFNSRVGAGSSTGPRWCGYLVGSQKVRELRLMTEA